MRQLLQQLAARFGQLPKAFYQLWLCESVVLFSSMIMEFALSIWVYQQSGSVQDFSHLITAALLPALLVLPLTSYMVDRFDRRYIIVTGQIMVLLITCALFWQLQSEALTINKMLIFNMAFSFVNGFQIPAYSATISAMLPGDKLTQVSGLTGVSSSFLEMLAPMIAGMLMAGIGLSGIVSIQILCLGIGLMILINAVSSIGRHYHQLTAGQHISELTGFTVIQRFLHNNPLLLGLLFYVMLQHALVILASTFFMPLVLSHYNEQQLGIILSIGSIGGLSGAGLLMFNEQPRHLMRWVLIADSLLGACILIAGLYHGFWVYCLCIFCALFAGGFAQGCMMALWMRKVPLHYQGRMFSLLNALVLASGILITLSAGFMVEQYFDPALSHQGHWSQSLGQWLGNDKGSGLSLLFVLSGFSGFLLSILALCSPLRFLDERVADIETLTVEVTTKLSTEF